MQKKLTITVDEEVYRGLHAVIGRRRISQFIETLLRPHVLGAKLEDGYRAMAADDARETCAKEWTEGTLQELPDETW